MPTFTLMRALNFSEKIAVRKLVAARVSYPKYHFSEILDPFSPKSQYCSNVSIQARDRFCKRVALPIADQLT